MVKPFYHYFLSPTPADLANIFCFLSLFWTTVAPQKLTVIFSVLKLVGHMEEEVSI